MEPRHERRRVAQVSIGMAASKLSPRQMRFAAEYIKDPAANGTKAAERAGYSPRCAKQRACYLLKLPNVAAEIEAMRVAVRTGAVYDAVVAMDELKAGMDFAKATENATAFVRAVELRSKLSGLLSDRLDVNMNQKIDVSAYLTLRDAARARVANLQRPALDAPFRVLSESPAISTLLPTHVGEPSIFE